MLCLSVAADFLTPKMYSHSITLIADPFIVAMRFKVPLAHPRCSGRIDFALGERFGVEKGRRMQKKGKKLSHRAGCESIEWQLALFIRIQSEIKNPPMTDGGRSEQLLVLNPLCRGNIRLLGELNIVSFPN